MRIAVDNDFVAGDIFKVPMHHMRTRVHGFLECTYVSHTSNLTTSYCFVSCTSNHTARIHVNKVFSSILSQDGPGVDSLQDGVDDFHYLGALD